MTHPSGDDMRCPRCNVSLSREVLVGLELDRCNRCTGVWVDPGEGEPLTRPDGTVPPELVRKVADTRKLVDEGSLPCPRCAQPMQRERYAESLVTIDRCSGRGCGVWLDGGEVEKIQSYRKTKLDALAGNDEERRARLEQTFARIYFDLGKRK